jgi:hypothetical protein
MKIRKLFKKGIDIKTISEITGMSYSGVYAMIQRNNIKKEM